SLLCVAQGAKESRRFCLKKQARKLLRLQHDSRPGHFLLLGCFVFLQRNRERAAIDRSGAVATKREGPCTSGLAVESVTETPRTVARYRVARHECGRHSRFNLTHAPTYSTMGLRRFFCLLRDRAPRLPFSARSPSKIAFPAISISRFGAPCGRARIRVDP